VGTMAVLRESIAVTLQVSAPIGDDSLPSTGITSVLIERYQNQTFSSLSAARLSAGSVQSSYCIRLDALLSSADQDAGFPAMTCTMTESAHVIEGPQSSPPLQSGPRPELPPIVDLIADSHHSVVL
jgi:hypothetical protein